jgi:hypothetical protein
MVLTLMYPQTRTRQSLSAKLWTMTGGLAYIDLDMKLGFLGELPRGVDWDR